MGDVMPYKYLHKGNRYGLKNLRTGKIIWYDPKKVSSMEELRHMARIREAFSHGFKPTKIKVKKHKRKGRNVKKHNRRLR